MSTIAPPPPSAMPSTTGSQEVLVTRLIGGAAVTALAIYVLVVGINSAMPIILLTLPLVVGALVSVIASDDISSKTDTWGDFFEVKLDAARAAEGKFKRWFKRPLYGGLAFLWRITRPIQYRHIRASLRVTGLIYFGCLMIYLLIMAVYIIVAIVVLGLILWVVSKFAGWESDREPTTVPFFARTGRSVQREGLTGPYVERYDEHGRKIGESRVRDGLLGQYVEHTGRDGKKIGESRERQGLLGDYTEHTDEQGHKVGESRTREGLLEDYVEHTDEKGKKVGESHLREGLLEDHVEHKES